MYQDAGSSARIESACRWLILAVVAGISLSLAPAWKSNAALWARVVSVSSLHARGWLNLGSALADQQDLTGAALAWDHARALALHETRLPELERQIVLVTVDQNLVMDALRRGNPDRAGRLMQEAYESAGARWFDGGGARRVDP